MNDVIEAGIDYLAMTLPIGHKAYPEWVTSCQHAIDLLIGAGNVPRVGAFRGYDGIWCGGGFTGQRDDGAYLHIPGAWAGRLWSTVHHPDAHYSRLDLQATIRYEEFDAQLAHKAYTAANTYNETRALRQRRKLRLITNNDGGSTCYVGSRTSDHYCRLYNKAAASGDEYYERCWRFEVELHNDTATAAATYIYEGHRSQSRAAAATVWHYFAERGVHPAWTREGEENAVLSRTTPPSDIDRKLAWLAAQVAPTVKLLRELVGDTIVFRALGVAPDEDKLPVENRPEAEG